MRVGSIFIHSKTAVNVVLCKQAIYSGLVIDHYIMVTPDEDTGLECRNVWLMNSNFLIYVRNFYKPE